MRKIPIERILWIERKDSADQNAEITKPYIAI